MITAFLTFVFFFAIVGCVLYGRKLIKTEKTDKVYRSKYVAVCSGFFHNKQEIPEIKLSKSNLA